MGITVNLHNSNTAFCYLNQQLVLPGQVQRTGAHKYVLVCSGHLTDIFLQSVPRISVEPDTNLGSDIGQKKCLIHMFLTKTMVTSSCHVTPVKATSSKIRVEGPTLYREFS
jgi:hypothetical protein